MSTANSLTPEGNPDVSEQEKRKTKLAEEVIKSIYSTQAKRTPRRDSE